MSWYGVFPVQQLPTADIVVLVLYVAGVVAFGCWFVRRSRTTAGFMVAGGGLPGWAVGLSIFGTYLSSNTFLGVPGKAYGANWNSFVFSLSLPLAALIAVRFFVPFYRRSGEISAYHHLERRFGGWARTYAVICSLLTQLARMATIMFGVALALDALTGWGMANIMIVTGILVTLYTLIGGIEAVIWTDVAQSIVLTIGALVVTVLLLLDMPEGPGQIVSIAMEHGKFSLGSFGTSLGESTFWVVLIYGLVMNLNNFGIDQSFVQRYHTAKSDREAGRSVWLCACLYLPISAVFFFIGTALFAYYQARPEMLDEVKTQVAAERLDGTHPQDEARLAAEVASLAPKEYADKVFPHFIVSKLPPGVAGLLIAAIFAAAMSSIDTSLNSSATVILSDVYRRYVDPAASERASMRVLYTATLAMGTAGTGAAVAMIGIESVLDVWWKLSGIFAGGMLGLFLLGIIARHDVASHRLATTLVGLVAMLLGLAVILWMTFSADGDFAVVNPLYESFGMTSLPRVLRLPQSPYHKFLIPVFGTATILVSGLVLGVCIARPHSKTTDSPRRHGVHGEQK